MKTYFELTKANLKQHTRYTRLLSGEDMAKDDVTTINDDDSSDTTTTDPAFANNIYDRGIRCGATAKEPDDFEEIRAYLDRERTSPQPDKGDFEAYSEELSVLDSKAQVRDEAWSFLAKRIPGFYTAIDVQWNNIHNDLTKGLHYPKPDKSMSYPLDRYPRTAREGIGGAIQPRIQSGRAMPHLCLECKPPPWSTIAVMHKCAYDGAVMVHAAQVVHDYLERDPNDFIAKTQALTIAYTGNDLRIFANHVIGKNNAVEYHQVSIRSCSTDDSFSDFKKARKLVRNAQQWASERES